MEDITPSLIQKVNKAFKGYYKSDKSSAVLISKIKKGGLTYGDAYKYASIVGNARAKAFKSEISSAVLPDGRMYYNIGSRLINETLESDYKMISSYTAEAQRQINKRARLGIKPQSVDFDKEKVKGFIDRLDSEPDFDKVAWILDEPVRLHALNIVDDTIKKNAEFQSSVGVRATVIRIPAAGCCPWCDDLAGEYTYPGVPSEVFTRHDNCRCTIDYNGERMTGYTWGSSHNFKD